MKNWAAQALKEMRETGMPVKIAVCLRGPVFDVQDGDTIELRPVDYQSNFSWNNFERPSTPTPALVLVRWKDGRARLAIVATRKGPHALGQRLRFQDSRGRMAWIGPKGQLAVVCRVASRVM